jgi:hypothetical protein
VDVNFGKIELFSMFEDVDLEVIASVHKNNGQRKESGIANRISCPIDGCWSGLESV